MPSPANAAAESGAAAAASPGAILRSAAIEAGRGIHRNAVAGVVLWIVGLAMVLAYYHVPATRPYFTAAARAKDKWGFAFSAITTTLAGGVVPLGIMALARRLPTRRRGAMVLFVLLFWAYKGIEVDLFYRLQAMWFGAAATLGIVVKKVCIDQFVYNPFWAAPMNALAYSWRDGNFTRDCLRQNLRPATLGRKSLVVLLGTWGLWIPAVSIIYSLPSDLQVPLFDLVLCFWVLALCVITEAPMA